MPNPNATMRCSIEKIISTGMLFLHNQATNMPIPTPLLKPIIRNIVIKAYIVHYNDPIGLGSN
ncbi:2063_t:CDS:2 [Scutellospora calospora]|uniref:2063_t:CDS:1 n=1 Tax=Scutellospora calospora TaxID=85575 RepID=A0ACA9KFK1_9GLOM|nr:2063_t:CDS:2 [Scutellospora calospora]